VTQRVLVTGGRLHRQYLVDQLLERDYSVFVLDDLSRGHVEAVAEGARFVQGNVGNRELVEALLTRERIDSVVHLAAFALVAESVAQPQKYVTNNVAAARVLLEAVARAGVRRFLLLVMRGLGIQRRFPLRKVPPAGQSVWQIGDFEDCWRLRASMVSASSLRYFMQPVPRSAWARS
jgi:UDP-glucose 4-epimerase